MRAIADAYDERVLIGETFIDSRLYDSTIFYGNNTDELHLPLTFEFAFSPWYPGYLQREIEKKEIVTPPREWPTYFLDNHDIPRHLSRWVECSLCIDTDAIAKAAAALLLTVRGTPFLYYGQEIGMVNHDSIPPELARDQAVVCGLDGECLPCRDGTRTPMQWDDSPQAGFSFGKDVQPWLPLNDNFKTLNVAAQLTQSDSVLTFYRHLLRVRKASVALCHGQWRSLIDYPYEHMAYLRETDGETVLVLINFTYDQDLTLKDTTLPQRWQVLLSTTADRQPGHIIKTPTRLEPFEVSILAGVEAERG